MKNRIAKLLKTIAIITLVGGIVLTIWGITDIDDYLALFCVGIGGLISAAFIRGFAEIVELLQNIKDNTSGEPAPPAAGSELNEEKEVPASDKDINTSETESSEEQKEQADGTESDAPEQNNRWWRCECGRVNRYSVVTCRCGKSRDQE
jgi:hypothetical protein